MEVVRFKWGLSIRPEDDGDEMYLKTLFPKGLTDIHTSSQTREEDGQLVAIQLEGVHD
jgi:hypothetical protein